MEIAIGYSEVGLLWLAGSLALGLLFGCFVGGVAWWRQAALRRQAYDWLREERARNVALWEENTNLVFMRMDRERWKATHEASLEAQSSLRQELGERDATISLLTAQNESLEQQVAASQATADGLRSELEAANVGISTIEAQNTRLIEAIERHAAEGRSLIDSKGDAVIAEIAGCLDALTEALKRTNAQMAERGERDAETHEALVATVVEKGEALSKAIAALSASVEALDARGAKASETLAASISEVGDRGDKARKALAAAITELGERGDKANVALGAKIDSSVARVEELEAAVGNEMAEWARTLSEDVRRYRKVSQSDSMAAARADLSAQLSRQETLMNTAVRKLSDQTRAILSSPQFVDFLADPGVGNDVPENLMARVVTARVMRSLGWVADAVSVLEACREEDAHSRTIIFDLAECLIELRRKDEADNLLSAIDAEKLETARFRARLVANRKALTPGIFLCALPKSAGVFIYNSLASGLDKPLVHIGAGGYFPKMAIPQSAPDLVSNAGAVYHIHAEASRSNLIEINNRLDRMVLHLRDPRGALLSWTHFIARVVHSVDPVQREHYGLPGDIEDWSFASQLDWQLENFLPKFVAWTEEWLAAVERNELRVPVLVTTYEDMVLDQGAFFDKLLEFYSINGSWFDYPARPSEGYLNFRKGDPAEWKSVFSAKQREIAARMVSVDMRERFGWEE